MGELEPETTRHATASIVSAGASRIALAEAGRVLVFDLPALEVTAEISVSGDFDVAFAGDRRLAILERTAAGATTLHLIDPSGPTKLGEVVFRTPARIAAVAGDHVLVFAAGATLLIDVAREPLAATTLPIRTAVTAAGCIGPDRFVIAGGGILEEWHAATRAPTRRLRLDPPQSCAYVGGTAERWMWMIPAKEQDHVDVISMTARSSRRIELPERPSAIAAHPDGELLAAIGADTRSAYVIDLAARESAVRIDRRAIDGVAWIGHGRTLAVHPIGEALDLVTIPILDEPPRRRPPTPPPPVEDWAGPDPVVQAAPPMIAAASTHDALAAWRERVQASRPAREDAEPPSPISSRRPARPQVDAPSADGGWRRELASWARAILAGARREPPAEAPLLHDLCAHMGLDTDERIAVALLYGAMLAGAPVAPCDLAAVLRWDAIVGDARSFVRRRRDRCELVPELVRVLDERAPRWGHVFAGRGVLEEAVAVVAPGDVDLASIGAWAAERVGGLLVANRDGEVFPARCALEARARGRAPMLRHLTELISPIVLVVDGVARARGLRIVATWGS